MITLVSEGIWDFNLDAALAKISEQRREQALKFKYEQGRRTCVLAYELLKQGLREGYGITGNPLFEYGEHGKPSLVGHPDIHFNLSHCRDAVVCAIGNEPVGIDVESVREYRESLVRYTMNDSEVAQIEAAQNPAMAFTRLWTMKEAAFKLIGTGIDNNLKDIISPHYRFTTVEAANGCYAYTICTLR